MNGTLQEAYYKKKGCTFNDPPPGTQDADDDNDDESISPTTFTSGWCGIHVIQYQKNEPGNSVTSNNPEYQLEVCVFDAKQVLLNQYPGESPGTCALFVAPNGMSQPVRGPPSHHQSLYYTKRGSHFHSRKTADLFITIDRYCAARSAIRHGWCGRQ